MTEPVPDLSVPVVLAVPTDAVDLGGAPPAEVVDLAADAVDLTVFDRAMVPVGVLAPARPVGFLAVTVEVLPGARLPAPRSDRVGLEGISPLAIGRPEFRLFPPILPVLRPTLSTDQVLFLLLDTLTRFPPSSSEEESSSLPPRRPKPELARFKLVSVRVDHPPLEEVP